MILLRHAHSIANEKGVLAGRASGISLSKKGEAQAQELKVRLGSLNIKEIRISPLERCLFTLQPWLNERGILERKIVFDKGFSEVDYGAWTGKKPVGGILKAPGRLPSVFSVTLCFKTDRA